MRSKTIKIIKKKIKIIEKIYSLLWEQSIQTRQGPESKDQRQLLSILYPFFNEFKLTKSGIPHLNRDKYQTWCLSTSPPNDFSTVKQICSLDNINKEEMEDVRFISLLTVGISRNVQRFTTDNFTIEDAIATKSSMSYKTLTPEPKGTVPPSRWFSIMIKTILFFEIIKYQIYVLAQKNSWFSKHK